MPVIFPGTLLATNATTMVLLGVLGAMEPEWSRLASPRLAPKEQPSAGPSPQPRRPLKSSVSIARKNSQNRKLQGDWTSTGGHGLARDRGIHYLTPDVRFYARSSSAKSSPRSIRIGVSATASSPVSTGCNPKRSAVMAERVAGSMIQMFSTPKAT